MVTVTVLVAGIGAIVMLLALSAFFSSSETAIFSLPDEWFEQMATDDRRANVLRELHNDPHRLLVTLLVGNNIVNIAISSIVTVLVASVLQPGITVVVTTVLTSCLILIFGEIVPKAYGNAKCWSLAIALPVRTVERLLSPLITLFDGLTRRINALISADSNIEKPDTD